MTIEDQKAKIRQYRYLAASILTLAGPAIAAALLEGGVSKWIAAAVAIGGVLSGAGALGQAASRTKSQRADGMFDPAPAPPTPLEQVITGVAATVQNKLNADAGVRQMQDTVTEALSKLPGLSPVQQAIRDTLEGKR